MAKYLLDTNACIVYIKFANSKVKERLETIAPHEIAVCSIVKYEMYFGSRKSNDPQKSLQLQDEFFKHFESLPFDDRAARHAAEIRATLSRSGQMIGAYDIQIAAIALANDLILITHNVSEFTRVSGLKIEDWEQKRVK